MNACDKLGNKRDVQKKCSKSNLLEKVVEKFTCEFFIQMIVPKTAILIKDVCTS